MTKLHSDCDYENIFPNKTWKLEDYEELFKYISPGYLVHAECSPGFVVNPDWDEEPMWEPELCSEDEDDDKMECPECLEKFNCDEFEYIPGRDDGEDGLFGWDVCSGCYPKMKHLAIIEDRTGQEQQFVFCEVGDHYVDPDDMWHPNFADCKGCVSEKEYREAIACNCNGCECESEEE